MTLMWFRLATGSPERVERRWSTANEGALVFLVHSYFITSWGFTLFFFAPGVLSFIERSLREGRVEGPMIASGWLFFTNTVMLNEGRMTSFSHQPPRWRRRISYARSPRAANCR